MKARVIMFKLLKLVKPLMLNMIIAITLGLCGHLAASFITILAGYGLLGKIDFMPLVFILLILAILRAIFRYIEQASNHFIAFKLLALIRDKVFGALRKLAPAKLENKNAGNMISIITSDIELLEVFYAHTISPIMIALLFGIIMVIFIGSYHFSLGIIALCSYVVVGIVVPLLINYLSKNKGLIYRQFSGKLSSFVLESLRGIKEIIQYNSGNKRLNDLHVLTEKLDNEENSLKKVMAFNISLCNVIVLLANMVMLFYGGYLFGHGLIDFEAYLISVLALFSSFGPFIALANLGSGLQNTLAAGKRTLDILEEKPLLEDIEGNPSCDFGKLQVNNVNFSYDEELILQDISLEVEPKEILGIVGKSGSGKSTLLKLLMRFWQVMVTGETGRFTVRKIPTEILWFFSVISELRGFYFRIFSINHPLRFYNILPHRLHLLPSFIRRKEKRGSCISVVLPMAMFRICLQERKNPLLWEDSVRHTIRTSDTSN